ncbi:heterokaryon incompatibility protein-domain-containing protein [Hypoxylon sp. NC1633]|nr:heterokaryon incompatibility protein-domain-containing protein [Hypoxylon sp. NC1633]
MDLNGAHSCEYCSKLVLDLASGRLDSTNGANRLVFNFNLQDLQHAHTQGCLLLNPIVSAWLSWNPSLFSQWEDRMGEIVLFASIEYHFHEEGEDEHYDCDLNAIDGMGLWDTASKKRVHMPVAGEFYVVTSDEDAASAAIKSRPIAIDPASDETFSQLRENLNSCLRMEKIHIDCRNTAGSYVPSRLLKLDACSQDPPKVRLCSPDEPTPYAVLSYCWGGDQTHKTTSMNLAANYISIAWDSLPRTIQDAIQVAVKIGLEYIWVDSICIIQDDNVDKQREIACMPRIYNESVVTIVAARAKSAREGFLHHRDTSKYKDGIFKLEFKCGHGTSGHAYLVKERQYDYGRSDPTDSRAWTLQESYLSKRIIRYGSKQCSMICQCSPSKPQIVDGWVLDLSYDAPDIENILFPVSKLDLSPEDIAKWKHYYKEEHGVNPNIESSDYTGDENIYKNWRELVMDYSSRSLTVPTDRILAISGLADRIAPAMQSRYVAGHWETHLPEDLLWEIAFESMRMRPTDYQGPSWSWTSVNGSIMSFDYMSTDTATLKILDVEVELCDSLAQFGAVKSGLLRAKGKLVEARWNGTELLLRRDRKTLSLANIHFVAGCLSPDTLDEEFIRVSNHSQNPWNPLVARYAEAIAAENTKPPTPPREYDMYLLEIFPAGANTGFDTKTDGSRGLILKDSKPERHHQRMGRPRTLRRIGVFNFSHHSNRESEVSVQDWETYVSNQRHCFDDCELEEIVIE